MENKKLKIIAKELKTLARDNKKPIHMIHAIDGELMKVIERDLESNGYQLLSI